ncbi:MAG: DUF4340 domain-containing protein [Clostridia bacterium]|nr:DUF4340 domain-containing protein [Clostridia bacterium]
MDKNDKNSFENYEKRISEEFENSTIFNSENHIETKTTHKKKVKNNYVKLLCLLLCFIIILGSGIFSVVKFWPDDNLVEPTTSSNDSTFSLTSEANISLKNMKGASKDAISNVKKIYIKNETDEFICVPYKDSFSKTVNFKLDGIDEDIPIDNDYITGFYNSVFDVNAVSKLEDKWTIEDCGLDKPKITVEVTMANDTEFDIKVGKAVGTNDGYYYVSTSLKDGIYIAEGSVYDSFSSDLFSLIDLSVIKTLSEEDNSEYFSNGKLSNFDYIKINGENFNNVELSCKKTSSEIMPYYINNPVKTYADDEKITTLLDPFSNGLDASAVYEIKPQSKDFSEYGLDNPYFEIEYKINDKVYNLKFSKPGIKDSNYCACYVNDIPVIYAVMLESVEFVDWNFDNLRYNLLYLKDIQTFKSYTVSYNGKSYKYDLSFDEEEPEGDTTSENTEKVLSVSLNSSPIKSENFRTAYQRLTLASATRYLGKDVTLSKQPDLMFEIEFQDGSVDKITYTKYNDVYYLHKLNGIGDELIPTRTVESLILNYEKLRKGETVPSPNNQQ